MSDDTNLVHRLTKDELAESLIFYRRRLTMKLAVEMLRKGNWSIGAIAEHAEDLANALAERLEARETGKVGGYRDE